MQLTRRQLNSLYVQTKALCQAALMPVKKYRDNPDLAAHEAERQAEASIRNQSSKRNGRGAQGK